jgi:hypothetical protein
MECYCDMRSSNAESEGMTPRQAWFYKKDVTHHGVLAAVGTRSALGRGSSLSSLAGTRLDRHCYR